MQSMILDQQGLRNEKLVHSAFLFATPGSWNLVSQPRKQAAVYPGLGVHWERRDPSLLCKEKTHSGARSSSPGIEAPYWIKGPGDKDLTWGLARYKHRSEGALSPNPQGIIQVSSLGILKAMRPGTSFPLFFTLSSLLSTGLGRHIC